ncbi:hypothetical protein NPIL_146991 [Nephila pilipes]|uniref:Uncharacterized protein n=1 Tax=Nephila pilipes TaxID=299642 RepID=A0A8X6NTK2_NEPPI|nr:hypothetical protein NPIL_146991 [Nephila pilipes]
MHVKSLSPLSSHTDVDESWMPYQVKSSICGLRLQLSLDVINSILSLALILYTDGSRFDSGRTDSGVLMKTSTGEHKYYFRNPYHRSSFRFELVAIREAINLALEADADDV